MNRSTLLWPFAVYAAVSALHVGAMLVGAEPLVYPTKLLLMPALAFAVVWALRGAVGSAPGILLLGALAFSWLGDGAALFFPFLGDELPAMLACFGIAHLLYMWLFARHLRIRPLAPWALVYALWWGATLVVLWPHLGALAVAVAIYGLVLGGTAALSTRGGTITAVGGAFFLASDTILAMRLFLPPEISDTVPSWSVMLTYTIGQGLLAYGATRLLTRSPARNERMP